MKKKTIIIGTIAILLLIVALVLRIISNNRFKGYWCNYDERSSIVVLLKNDHTQDQDKKLLAKIDEFQNVISSSYYSREDYEGQLGENPDIYDSYVIIFSSLDSIGTYIEELKALDGVLSAEQNTAKTNFSLYNIKTSGRYTFADSDEVTEEDLETGKYKIKNGVITFKPNDNDKETKMLYIKDGYLCGDANCTKIFAESNATCSTEN